MAPPAFVDYPVIVTDRPGTALFSKLGPWRRSEALKTTLGAAVASIRGLRRGGRWLVGCTDAAQQAALGRLSGLVGGIQIGCRIPVPRVEGVVSPIPPGDWHVRQVRADLIRDGYRVTHVTRILTPTGGETGLVRIAFEGTELPSEVWLAQSPFPVTAYAAPVRRCTKCQRLGHTKGQCRAEGYRCPRCGRPDHRDGRTCTETPSCINCSGRHSAAWQLCPEVKVRQQANILKNQNYIPYSVALQRAREDLFPTQAPAQTQEQKRVHPDSCWAQDRAANPPAAGQGPTRTYANVLANRGTTTRGQAPVRPRNPPKAGGETRNPAPSKDHPRPIRAERVPVEGRGPSTPQQQKTAVARGFKPPAATPQSKNKQGWARGSQPLAATTPKPRAARKLKLSTSRRNDLRQRAATLKPFLLAKQAKRVRTEVLAQQKKETVVKRQRLRKTLLDLLEQDRREHPEKSRLRDLIWDFLIVLINTRTSGDPSELLKLITKLSNRATGEKSEVPPLTKYIDAALALTGLREGLSANHEELPSSF